MKREPTILGNHEPQTLSQLRDVASRAERTALMADGHLGYIMPVGGVAAYRNRASVAGVGFDIACGNAAIRTDLKRDDFGPGELMEAADLIHRTLSFGIGRNNHCSDAPTDHEIFDDPAWSAVPDQKKREGLRTKARNQLGTIGSGNHYVDIFSDEHSGIWVGVHFGSRGFGHTVASSFMALSQNKPWGTRVRETEALLNLDSELGNAYWSLMSLAGRYAYIGREWVCRKVLSLLGARELELVHNHHNYAWKETHGGEELVVVRKGATPAWPGQTGFVGGSMGDDAVIIRGSTSTDPDTRRLQEDTLYSTVHGAGRVMSRTRAKGKIKRRRVVKPGVITHKMMHDWLSERGVILKGGGRDEAPQVYRRLQDVLTEQGPTIEVLHTLHPLIVVMAGEDEFDPYRD